MPQFTAAMCKMDVDWIMEIFPEDVVIHNLTREHLREELEALFSEFKMEGDTELRSHEGTCINDKCENCGSEGFVFVGKQSGCYFNFIIEMDHYFEFWHCHRMESKFGEIPASGKQIHFNPIESAYAFYRNDPDKLVRINLMEQGVQDLLQEGRILTKPEMHAFFNTFENDFETFRRAPKNLPMLNSFRELIVFYEIFDAFSFLLAVEDNMYDECTTAMREYRRLDKNDFTSLDDWYEKNMETFDRLDMCLPILDWPKNTYYFILLAEDLKVDKSKFEMYWEMKILRDGVDYKAEGYGLK